jgi:hypothetical protein
VLVNDPYGTTNDCRPRFKTTSIPSAQRFTWYKVTVHHVQMNVVRPGIDGALALLGQVGFVAVQDGGSNEGKAIVGGAAGRHTTVGGGGGKSRAQDRRRRLWWKMSCEQNHDQTPSFKKCRRKDLNKQRARAVEPPRHPPNARRPAAVRRPRPLPPHPSSLRPETSTKSPSRFGRNTFARNF